jgi:pyrimidine and pyridine-specific 5'-nucleotidase
MLIGNLDDSYINAKGAKEMGWSTVHFVERELDLPVTPASRYQIRELEELRDVFPQLFKNTEKAS